MERGHLQTKPKAKENTDEIHNHQEKQKEFDPERLTVSVDLIKNFKGRRTIGNFQSIFAFKNPSTYLVLTHMKGVKVIKDGKIIYSSKMQFSTRNILYSEHFDSFLLISRNILYMKGIDKKSPYLYMKLGVRLPKIRRTFSNLLHSVIKHKLVSFFRLKSLVVINLITKKTVLMISREIQGEIQQFKLFGEHRNKVLSITDQGHILLHVLNFSLKKLLAFNELKIAIEERPRERPQSIAVCDKHQYVFVEIIKHSDQSTRMLILKIVGNRLEKRAMISYEDPLDINGNKKALECCGYFGGHVLWVGLTEFRTEVAQFYAYNTKTRDFFELKKKKVNHQEKWPTRIHRIGNHLYYSGYDSRLMRLSITM